jgi:hypothetical protein
MSLRGGASRRSSAPARIALIYSADRCRHDLLGLVRTGVFPGVHKGIDVGRA